jgi:hypothetical protein
VDTTRSASGLFVTGRMEPACGPNANGSHLRLRTLDDKKRCLVMMRPESLALQQPTGTYGSDQHYCWNVATLKANR